MVKNIVCVVKGVTTRAVHVEAISLMCIGLIIFCNLFKSLLFENLSNIAVLGIALATQTMNFHM